jgi:ATP-dependent exoDNAse (exonuclease V) beta subunit
MRIVFGYSAVADYLLNRIAPYWYTGDVDFFDTKIDNDEVAVTCALLERLKKRVDQEHIRLLLFTQHSIDRILQENEPEEDFQRVIDCAEAAGIEVIDQFASLRAVAVLDVKEFQTYFVKEGKVHEHMSSKGNEQAAKLLSAALAKPQAKQSAKRGRPTPASGY